MHTGGRRMCVGDGQVHICPVSRGLGKAGVALDVVADGYIFVKDGRCEGTPPIEQGCGDGMFFFFPSATVSRSVSARLAPSDFNPNSRQSSPYGSE